MEANMSRTWVLIASARGATGRRAPSDERIRAASRRCRNPAVWLASELSKGFETCSMYRPTPSRASSEEACVRQRDRLPELRGLCAAAPGNACRTGSPASAIAGHPLSFYWSHPESGTRFAAYGEVARVEARSAREMRELFVALTRPGSVDWLDGPADARPPPPRPFFGALAVHPL